MNVCADSGCLLKSRYSMLHSHERFQSRGKLPSSPLLDNFFSSCISFSSVAEKDEEEAGGGGEEGERKKSTTTDNSDTQKETEILVEIHR